MLSLGVSTNTIKADLRQPYLKYLFKLWTQYPGSVVAMFTVMTLYLKQKIAVSLVFAEKGGFSARKLWQSAFHQQGASLGACAKSGADAWIYKIYP